MLLITNLLENSPRGGREKLCKLNFEILSSIYNENLYLYELNKKPVLGFLLLLNSFRGQINGIDNISINAIKDIIEKNKISSIFIDGSNLGEVARVTKLINPKIKVTTFFHNVESHFFWGAFKKNRTIRSLIIAIVNYLAERKAIKFSDCTICLNDRDSKLLFKYYGRFASHISPIALKNFEAVDKLILNQSVNEKYALFVGGLFYANLSGITWFVENVVPKIDIKIYIVGNGFESYKKQLEVKDKVVVIGSVVNLNEWYINACFIIAPIFDGSGMKTKVAEALMYGKKIVGTSEAFTGYEDVVHQVGTLCTTPDDFVKTISDYQKDEINHFDPNLRKIFDLKYSFEAAKLRFTSILK